MGRETERESFRSPRGGFESLFGGATFLFRESVEATTFVTRYISRYLGIVGTAERGGGWKGWMEARVLRQHSDVQTSKHLDLSGSGAVCVGSLPRRAATAAAATRVPLILPPTISFFVYPRSEISSQKPVGSFSPHPSFSLSRRFQHDVAGDGNSDY